MVADIVTKAFQTFKMSRYIEFKKFGEDVEIL